MAPRRSAQNIFQRIGGAPDMNMASQNLGAFRANTTPVAADKTLMDNPAAKMLMKGLADEYLTKENFDLASDKIGDIFNNMTTTEAGAHLMDAGAAAEGASLMAAPAQTLTDYSADQLMDSGATLMGTAPQNIFGEGASLLTDTGAGDLIQTIKDPAIDLATDAATEAGTSGLAEGVMSGLGTGLATSGAGMAADAGLQAAGVDKYTAAAGGDAAKVAAGFAMGGPPGAAAAAVSSLLQDGKFLGMNVGGLFR